jgi:hypothetical protein
LASNKIKGIELDKNDELNEVVGKLIEVTAKDQRFSWGSFLLDSIHKCADEETLTKMIADIREYTNLRITEPDKFM